MGPFFYVPHPSFQSVLSGVDNEEIMIPQCCPGERCEVVVGHRGHWYPAARLLVKPVGVVVGHWPDVGTGIAWPSCRAGHRVCLGRESAG